MRHARTDYNRIQDPAEIIPEDEPVFLIRGKDFAGPDAVRAWADIAELQGAEAHILEAARRQADRMEQYQIDHGGKIADMPQDAAA